MQKITVFIITLLIPVLMFSQDRQVAFGLQVEPIIPSALFRITDYELIMDNVTFLVEPFPGISYGANVSFGLTPRFWIETGINFISRSFRVSVTESDFSKSLKFATVNYEIPLTATYYVRLAERIFMGHSLGISMQMLPSHLRTIIDEKDATGATIWELEQYSERRYWAMPAFKGSIGWEFRTANNGFFYIGPVYRLFTRLYTTRLFYHRGDINLEQLDVKAIGDYFGINMRYTFPPSEMLTGDRAERRDRRRQERTRGN